MQLKFFRLQVMRNFGLAMVGSTMLLAGCSREMDKSASVSLQLPRLVQSKSAGAMAASSDMISMYIVTVSGPEFPPIIRNWEARKMCPPDATATSCQVPPMELSVPKGNNRMIQVLGLSGDGPGSPMTMYYFGGARNLTNNSESVDVVLEKLQQTSGKESVVKGRFLDGATSGPSGSVLMQFHPPVAGHPPMSLFRREILNGWFTFEFFSGFEVSYVLEKGSRVLFSRVKAGDDGMGSAAGVSGIFNPDARPVGAKMSLLHINIPSHQKFWTRYENGSSSLPSQEEVRTRDGSRLIVGYFGNPAYFAGKKVCHDAEISTDGVPGLYVAGAYSSPTLRVGGVATGAPKVGAPLDSALDALTLAWGGYQPTASSSKISVAQIDFDAGSSAAGAGRTCGATPNWDNEIRIEEDTIMDAGNEIENLVSFRGPFVVRSGYSSVSYEQPLFHVSGTGTTIQSASVNLMPGVLGSGISGVSLYFRMVSERSQDSHEFYDMSGLQCQAISEGAFGFQRFGPDIITDAGIASDETVAAPAGLSAPAGSRVQVVACPYADAMFGKRMYSSSGLSSEYYGSYGPGPSGGGGPSCPATPTNPPARLRFAYSPDPVDVGSCVNFKLQLVDNNGCPALVTSGQTLELGFPTYATDFIVSDSTLHFGQNCQAGNLFVDDTGGTQKQKYQFTLAAGQNEADVSLNILNVPSAERSFDISGNLVAVNFNGNASFQKEMRPPLLARPLVAQDPAAFMSMGPSLTALRMGECREIQLTAMRYTPSYTAVKVPAAYQVAIDLTDNGGGYLGLYSSPGCTGSPLAAPATVAFPAGSSVGRIYVKGESLSTGPIADMTYAVSGPTTPSVPATQSIVVYGAPVSLTVLNTVSEPATSSIFNGGPGFCKMIDLRVRDAANNDVNMLGTQVYMPETLKIYSTGAAGLRAFRTNSGCMSTMTMYEIPINNPIPVANGYDSVNTIYVRSNSAGNATFGIGLGESAPIFNRNFVFHDVHQLKLQQITSGTVSTCSPVSVQYRFYRNDGVTLSTFVPNVNWSLSQTYAFRDSIPNQFFTVSNCSVTGEPIVNVTSTGGSQPPPLQFYVNLPASGTLFLGYGSSVATFDGENLQKDLSGTFSFP
ncbi:MAG: hypothetical protein K2X47_19650 [Bdellovibrionales bacterium]|nr:hypothetical protein [Bdellovibrionales bacterium]